MQLKAELRDQRPNWGSSSDVDTAVHRTEHASTSEAISNLAWGSTIYRPPYAEDFRLRRVIKLTELLCCSVHMRA
jgi:hypothetical protein